VAAVRNVRQEKNLPLKEQLVMQVVVDETDTLAFGEVMKKLSNLSSVELVSQKPDDAVSFLIKSTEYYIPLTGKIDIEEEIKKIETELAYNKGFLESVMKKLGNERFVNSAPKQVVENEMNKKADAEAKIKAMEERLASLR
jgi:valyl-tRNA synthetase